MSPPKKKQRNCSCPLRNRYDVIFKPAGTPLTDLPVVILEQDELEAVYLCDWQDLDQQKAGEKMGVSRGTVQRLVAAGRKKMIDALVGMKALAVAGDIPGEGNSASGAGPTH